MKTIIAVLVLTMLSTSVYARGPRHPRPPRPPQGGISEATLANSTIQTVAYVIADLIGLTSVATSDATSNNHRKEEATRIQYDLQEYNQSGVMSLYLADKINMVNLLNSDLSEADAIDALVIATDMILN